MAITFRGFHEVANFCPFWPGQAHRVRPFVSNVIKMTEIGLEERQSLPTEK